MAATVAPRAGVPTELDEPLSKFPATVAAKKKVAMDAVEDVLYGSVSLPYRGLIVWAPPR
jgi:hypothetical protein